ncbi:MAG: site-specific DNA-methyltransferase [Firmicutes bacterium]|nr:site-specific DNA-methyltransferase [Bacillota bacterium]
MGNGRIYDLLNGLETGRKQYNEIMESQSCRSFFTDEVYGCRDAAEYSGEISAGDNLEYMEYLIKERNMRGKLQLIYVDPPFFSNSRYQASVRLQTENLGTSPVIKTGAYDDKWEDSMEQYLTMLTVRFLMMKELLSDTGCIWVHLDWHGSHYVKMILDEIFGEDNFVNEVAWTYKSGGSGKRSFAKKHDTLLFYGKTKKYKFNLLKEKSYNRGLKPYRFKGVKEYCDETGWYTLVNMKDVWAIDMVGRTSGERTGYATQKPEKLLERIVEACSDEGDLCADFFAGSGTFGAVCTAMNRDWIMCDEGNVAVASQIRRITDSITKKEKAFNVTRAYSADEKGNPVKAEDKGFVRVASEMGMLKITEYKPDLFSLSREDEEIAARYAADDGGSLVNFWSIDRNYDGMIHRGEGIIEGKDFAAAGSGTVNIIGYDVLGNRFYLKKKV